MLKEFIDGVWCWRCLLCAVLVEVYTTGPRVAWKWKDEVA